eukprot:gene13702-4612_t
MTTMNTQNEIPERKTKKKKSRKRNRETKGVPDGKGQPCNSNENAAASEPIDDSKVQPGNSLENGEQEEDIVIDNKDGNANNTTESKTVLKGGTQNMIMKRKQRKMPSKNTELLSSEIP